MNEEMVARIRSNPKFAVLLHQRSSFAWTLTIIMLVVYYGFIMLVAFAPGVLGTSVAGSITLGFPLGVGVIVIAVLLTGIYVQRANGAFDRMTREIIASAESAAVSANVPPGRPGISHPAPLGAGVVGAMR